LTWQKFLLAF